jgi:trk system potassium uptake protein TrkA
MKGQIAVLGIGRFGYSLACMLYEMGHEVMAMDIDMKRVQVISPNVTHAVQGDATDESVLKDMGINEFEIVIVAVGSTIENSVLTTILLKKLGVKYVIARAISDLHGSILHKIGADQVVFPQRDMGRRIAHGVMLTDVSDYMSITSTYGISKIDTPLYFENKTLSESGFGRKGEGEIAVLLIQHDKEIIISPGEEDIIREGDVLVLASDDQKLAKFLAKAKEDASE